MEDQDFGWLDTILNLYRRDIERNYGGRTIGKTLNGDEAKATIQAHFTEQIEQYEELVEGTRQSWASQAKQLQAELLRARIKELDDISSVMARTPKHIQYYRKRKEQLQAELDNLEGEK